MRIEIGEIKNRGNHSEERVIFKALEDIDISYYYIMHTVYTDEGKKIVTKPLHTYWPQARSVKANDLIVLYTKSGEYSFKLNDDKTTSHFFYWGIPNSIYNSKNDCVVVLEIVHWRTSKWEL